MHLQVGTFTTASCPNLCRHLRSWAGGDASAVAALPTSVSTLNSMAGLAAAATLATLSSPRCSSPCAAASPTVLRSWRACCSGSPAHVHCFSAPASPAHDAAAAAATAARAVEAEVKALRSARRAYQRAALGQHDLCANVARTINDALRRDDAASAAASPQPMPSRPHSAGSAGILAVRRRKWQRDLAEELRGLC